MKTNKSRASKFLETVREVVARRCCAATSDVVAELGLSRNTAYHVLRRLHETGDVEKHKLGCITYWCVPGKSPASCGELRRLLLTGLCRVINGAKGGVVTVSVAELLRAAGYKTAPALLATAVKLFETFHLHLQKKRRKEKYVYFVVDVDKARRLCSTV